MSREDVNVKVSANVAEAIQLWKAMEEGPESMAKAIDNMGKKGKQSTSELGKSVAATAGEFLSAAAAIAKAREELERYYATKRENEERGAESAAKADKAVRTYFTRQRISDPAEQDKALKGIYAQAMKRTAPLDASGSAAAMLAEFGFPREQAEGDALHELLTLQDTVSGAGGDSETISRKVLEIIQRSGRPKTAESIRRLGVATNRLTGRAAGFDAAMMEEYATVASAATAGDVDQETGLAMWAALREKEDSKKAKKAFLDMMKPGEQRGEREARARAQQLLGGPGDAEKQYQEAADIASSSVQSRVDESEAAHTMNTMRKGAIPRDEALKRYRALMEHLGVPEEGLRSQITRENWFKHPGVSIPGLGWGTDSMWSTEQIVEREAQWMQNHGYIPRGAESREKMKRQVLGQDPLPFEETPAGRGGAQQMTHTIRIMGPDGLDVPHEPMARYLSEGLEAGFAAGR